MFSFELFIAFVLLGFIVGIVEDNDHSTDSGCLPFAIFFAVIHGFQYGLHAIIWVPVSIIEVAIGYFIGKCIREMFVIFLKFISSNILLTICLSIILIYIFHNLELIHGQS